MNQLGEIVKHAIMKDMDNIKQTLFVATLIIVVALFGYMSYSLGRLASSVQTDMTLADSIAWKGQVQTALSQVNAALQNHAQVILQLSQIIQAAQNTPKK